MNAVRILAIVLIVGGILGLIYGGFTYTKDSHDAKVGGLELRLEKKIRSMSRSGSAWER